MRLLPEVGIRTAPTWALVLLYLLSILLACPILQAETWSSALADSIATELPTIKRNQAAPLELKLDSKPIQAIVNELSKRIDPDLAELPVFFFGAVLDGVSVKAGKRRRYYGISVFETNGVTFLRFDIAKNRDVLDSSNAGIRMMEGYKEVQRFLLTQEARKTIGALDGIPDTVVKRLAEELTKKQFEVDKRVLAFRDNHLIPYLNEIDSTEEERDLGAWSRRPNRGSYPEWRATDEGAAMVARFKEFVVQMHKALQDGADAEAIDLRGQ